MECKDVLALLFVSLCAQIGIYPEWNVKLVKRIKSLQDGIIGIYPEWNVKHASGSLATFNAWIGIYPEWNVKEDPLESQNHLYPLEYIQNGM